MGRHSAGGTTSVLDRSVPAASDTRLPATPSQLRMTAFAMIGLALFVVAMVASYSGAFANPTLHRLEVAVVGSDQAVNALAEQEALRVNRVDDDDAARQAVYERRADTAFVITPAGELKIYIAGGGGRSVATAAEKVGQAAAAQLHLRPVVDDIAPTASGNPSGTVEFYAVIFLSIGASGGAAAFNMIIGKVGTLARFAWRTLTLLGYSALLAAAVTVYVHAVLDTDLGHQWQMFAALWLYALAVAGAITGLGAAAGTIASVVLTLFLVIVGNAAAAGPVGRPLLSGFYATLNEVVPQGSGVSLLRSIEYFGGNGSFAAIATLLVWGAAGLALAVVAFLRSRIAERS
ncbi:ABC-2 transporter permease [Mycolicibacterium mengxianglii]|uniref:hypothetical protein n=1 Tax=Mycolicibacterium mengxianglii TaxID=2736649 RepID=UPI0038CC1B6B